MEYLKELNNLQLKAVTTKSKKVLVVAGAGSGKTKVLTDRVKYLIDNGVNKNQILTFTFTKKAAKEMKDRLKDYNFDNVFTSQTEMAAVIRISAVIRILIFPLIENLNFFFFDSIISNISHYLKSSSLSPFMVRVYVIRVNTAQITNTTIPITEAIL